MTDQSLPAASRWTSNAIRIPVLLSGNVLLVMLVAAVNPALPAIERNFASEPNAGFLARLALTTPALFIALGSLPAGLLCNAVGRKPVLLVSVFGFAASGALCIASPNLLVLLAGRSLQGLFAAGVVTACTTLIADYFSGAARDRVIGLQGAAVSGSSMIFLLLSGVLATMDWRAPFGLYVATALLLPLMMVSIVEPLKRDSDIGAAVGPRRARLALMGFAVFSSVVMFMPSVHAPFLLAELGVIDPILIGLALALMTGVGIATALGYATLRAKLGGWGTFALALIFAGIGMGVLGFATSFNAAIAGLVPVGAGMGLMLPGLTTLALDRTSPEERAGVVGAVMASIFFGEFLSPLVSEPLKVLGASNMFFSFAGVAVLAAILILLGPTRRSHNEK